MKFIHEISKQALRSTKMEFNLLSCIRKSPDCSGDLPTVPSIIDELLKMASEDVVQNWCFPKGYFLRLTAQISEAGTFLLPKRETITFLKRRIRSCKPRESYATIVSFECFVNALFLKIFLKSISHGSPSKIFGGKQRPCSFVVLHMST